MAEVALEEIREAVRRLEALGLAEHVPHHGAKVTGLEVEELRELFSVRLALETIAVRRACERMSLDDIDFLRLLLMRQRRAADAGREDEFIDLDEQFHLRIAAGAQLQLVERFLRQLRGFVRLMRLGTSRRAGHLQLVLEEHTAIADALEARDADRAVAALHDHLRRSDY